ncbi:MAG: hypothetical protein ACE5SW_08035 [Nitrososphaeraceae archaeon]
MQHNNKNKKGNFANDQQKKFYLIGRAFKIGNIIGTTVLLFFVGKHFLGV